MPELEPTSDIDRYLEVRMTFRVLKGGTEEALPSYSYTATFPPPLSSEASLDTVRDFIHDLLSMAMRDLVRGGITASPIDMLARALLRSMEPRG